MSRYKTELNSLPNEIIYCIFEYLSANDILRAFVQLNQRFDHLVRFYVKRIDLTNGWICDRQRLQWLFETIEMMKIDRYHSYLLDDSDLRPRKDSLKHTAIKRKSFVRSTIEKFFGIHPSKPIITHHISTEYANRFPQLDSLELVNVENWNQLISNMNLSNLRLWFDIDNRYIHDNGSIPHSITQFSTNILFNSHNLHENLLDLTICISSIVHLVEIITHSPNIQCLSIIFSENFHNYHQIVNHQYSSDLKTIVPNLSRLTKLNCLSISTKSCANKITNKFLPFNKIHEFIQYYCPEQIILQKISFKFYSITFNDQLWSTIQQYRNTYAQFNCYISFIIEENTSNIQEIISREENHYDYHIEGIDSAHPDGHFIHVYSLPFVFDTLYGYSSCSLLSRQCSYFRVRHLYFTQTRLNHVISFESLVKRMPYLISIHCSFTFEDNFNSIIIPEIVVDHDYFQYIRHLNFQSHCLLKKCTCRNLLVKLLDRMPYLQSLTTSDESFIHRQDLLPFIQRLNLQECQFEVFELLPPRMPNLSSLFLNSITTNPYSLSQLVGSLFLQLPYLYFISFKYILFRGKDPLLYKTDIEHVLNLVQKMNDRVHSLKFELQNEHVIFHL